MFYLAQTLSCLDEFEESYKLYQKRGEITEGFWEERFHSYLRSAEICMSKFSDVELAIVNYIRSLMIDFRVEPLVALGKIYKDKHDYLTSYMFLSMACLLDFPKDNILFVAEKDYTYERWQQLSIVSYYVERYKEGMNALDIAKKLGEDLDVHFKNQEAYQGVKDKKDKELFDCQDTPPELQEIYTNFIEQGRKAVFDRNHETVITKLIQAFQLTYRISPLIILAEYARLNNGFHLAYHLVTFTLQFKMPPNISKQEKKDYDYVRHHLIGIVGFYTNHHKEGREACLKSIKEGYNIALDRRNLVAYIEAEKEMKKKDDGKEVKEMNSDKSEKSDKSDKNDKNDKSTENKERESLKDFKERRSQEIMALNPKTSLRQAQAKAQLEWKLKNK